MRYISLSLRSSPDMKDFAKSEASKALNTENVFQKSARIPIGVCNFSSYLAHMVNRYFHGLFLPDRCISDFCIHRQKTVKGVAHAHASLPSFSRMR